ncbi:RNA-binding S4 domain-containing protein [uncultured Marixanthomonas sp.]|uniref:RNA-binding S4 domain-containing protein n=1 Tax=uncultured Marixanthomonas sp. TaxID=757245 RepID=UPI0030D841FE|tara:strand:+ start:94118 stop:94492 length:375 start_codon:yes stop_codon:yes gene_type:complete
MRVDKYLWCIRYYKTRSIATKACKKGAVQVNGDGVKPARDVYPGDKIRVRKNQINYELEVLDLPKNRLGAKLVDIYRKDITPKEAFEGQEMLQYAKKHYRKKGTGRPTKKDRRDLEDFTDSQEE